MLHPNIMYGARRGRMLAITGIILIAVLFVWYNRYQDPESLTPQAISAIHWLAQMFYVLLAACLGMISWGLYTYHRANVYGHGPLSAISAYVDNKKSRAVFVVAIIAYGVFFSLASGTLVYQPAVNFAEHYGVQIPSVLVSPCCGDMGYMPTILVYITEHVGLQIIPLNLVLQVTVSYLVALNVALAASAYAASRRAKGAGMVGAVTGLFVACPTCVGTLSSIFIGTAGGIALSATLSYLQTAFIAVSIPVLLITPFILVRQIRRCRI